VFRQKAVFKHALHGSTASDQRSNRAIGTLAKIDGGRQGVGISRNSAEFLSLYCGNKKRYLAAETSTGPRWRGIDVVTVTSLELYPLLTSHQ